MFSWLRGLAGGVSFVLFPGGAWGRYGNPLVVCRYVCDDLRLLSLCLVSV